VLVDPAYGGSSSSDTAPSTASMRGAMAAVNLEDTPPPAGDAPLQMFERPALHTEDLVTVALTAFGPGQAQSLLLISLTYSVTFISPYNMHVYF